MPLRHKIEGADQCRNREKNHKGGQNNRGLPAALFVFRFEIFTEDQIENGHNAALHKRRQHIIRAPGVEQIFYRQIHIRIINIRMTEAECGGNSGKKCNTNQQQPGKCKRLSAEIKNRSDREQYNRCSEQYPKKIMEKITKLREQDLS